MTTTDPAPTWQLRFADRYIPWIRAGKKVSTIRHGVLLAAPGFTAEQTAAIGFKAKPMELVNVTRQPFAMAEFLWLKRLPDAIVELGRSEIARMEGFEGENAWKVLMSELEHIYGTLVRGSMQEFTLIRFQVTELLPWAGSDGQGEMNL